MCIRDRYKLDELSLKKKKPITLKIVKEILKVKNWINTEHILAMN